jgi:DNA-binding CsgD family transcriptional regulator/tetratricopeptide (TPR) repeat protein
LTKVSSYSSRGLRFSFSGGRTLEAIEAICDAEGDLPVDAFEGISSLLDKSLLRQEEGPNGEPRFVMLETVHEFAREKLGESAEAEEIKRVHAEYFLTLAEEAYPELKGPDQLEWLERLEAEHDNMRAALSWALEQEEAAELGLRLAGALWLFWEARGYYGEGHSWLEQVLARGSQASAAARIKALEGEGWLIFDSDETDETVIAAREGLKLSDEAGLGGAVRAKFLDILGWKAMMGGDRERAKELLEECLKLRRDAKDELGIADALLGLGGALDSPDDRKRAKELHEEGIVLCRKLGYVRTLASHLFSLGFTLLLEGDYERGAALNEEAAALYRERGYKGGLEYALDNLGWAALLQGDPERARSYYRESLMLCKELGNKIVASESLGCISVDEGATERVTRLFGSAEALREAVGFEHGPERDAWSEPYLAARSRMDEAAWAQAWAEGRAMSMEQAIEYALSEEKPVTPPSPESEQPSSDEPPSLTRREKEVAVLITRGLTNRQIASELVPSEHTVITHVRNILGKLNLHSRTQLTLWVTERQPHP